MDFTLVRVIGLISIFCLFPIPSILWETVNHSLDCELILVQVIYRHGDRNPIKLYPNDPYQNESFWPEGFGQLTKEGKIQQYLLGEYLRTRYDGFLNEVYSPYEIFVQSSTIDRAIASADANLAGLYPPKDNQSRWNDKIYWQPIPVHNKPEFIDNTISLSETCPRYQELLNDFVANSDVMLKVNLENKYLYQLLANHTGTNVTSPKDVDYIMDNLLIEKIHNFTLPKWTEEVLPKYGEQLKYLSAFSFKVMSYTKELQRLKGGPLLKELIENMKAKMNHSMDARRKLFMYSGHDTTIATLLNALDVFDIVSPPYRSMVIMELHRNISSDEYFVQILYRNSTQMDPYEMVIPGCSGFSCMFPEFMDLTASRIPDNWENECRPSSVSSTDMLGLIVGTMLIFILTGLCVCVGLILKAYIRNKRRGPQPPRYPYLHLQTEDGDGDEEA